MSRWIAPGVALSASAWLLLIVAAPSLTTPVAAALYAAGSLICHQLADRSFHLQNAQLPVCARCVGIYGGAAVGSLAGATALGRRWLAWWRPPATRSLNWIATALAASPTIATFGLEWGFGWPISNTVRAVAALPFGFAVAFVVVSALATVHSSGVNQLENPQPPASTTTYRPRPRGPRRARVHGWVERRGR